MTRFSDTYGFNRNEKNPTYPGRTDTLFLIDDLLLRCEVLTKTLQYYGTRISSSSNAEARHISNLSAIASASAALKNIRLDFKEGQDTSARQRAWEQLE